jgi:hypothetical protein
MPGVPPIRAVGRYANQGNTPKIIADWCSIHPSNKPTGNPVSSYR